MIYCLINKEKLLYFRLDVLCLSEARVPEFEVMYRSTAAQYFQGEISCPICATLAVNRQTSASPKYNDDITLPIGQEIISDCYPPRLLSVVWPKSVTFLYWVPWKLMGRMTQRERTVVIRT